jgi:hypothetical protein
LLGSIHCLLGSGLVRLLQDSQLAPTSRLATSQAPSDDQNNKTESLQHDEIPRASAGQNRDTLGVQAIMLARSTFRQQGGNAGKEIGRDDIATRTAAHGSAGSNYCL